MRSNGLTATAYTPVADLEPVLASALLVELKAQGVAAYTKPVESTTTSGFDRPEFRVGASDRLYVDAAASSRVRDLLSARDPQLLDDNDDLTWAQIVSGFDQPLDTDVAPWPVQESLVSDDDEGRRPDSAHGAQTGPASEVIVPRTDQGKRPPDLRRRRTDVPEPPDDRLREEPDAAHTEPFDDADFLASTSKTSAGEDDGFVPDPPPPLPRLAPHRQVAWLGVLGGPLLLLVAAVFGLVLPDWLAALGVLGFIGGFITLVATMGDPDHRDDGPWGSGDGAVV